MRVFERVERSAFFSGIYLMGIIAYVIFAAIVTYFMAKCSIWERDPYKDHVILRVGEFDRKGYESRVEHFESVCRPQLIALLKEGHSIVVDLDGYMRYGPTMVKTLLQDLTVETDLTLEELKAKIVFRHSTLKSIVFLFEKILEEQNQKVKEG